MKNLLVAMSAFGLVLVPCAQSRTPHREGSPNIEITHQARSLQPGEVVRITLKSTEPVKAIKARAFGRTFPFYPEKGLVDWHGLIGVDLETKADTYKVKVSCMMMDGATIALEHPLAIREKSFPTRTLTVDNKFVNPPKNVLDRIRSESNRVRGIFAAVTPKRLWSGSFTAPVPGAPSSSFGKRSILNGQPRSPHSGADFSAVSGTPVKAPNAGKVILAANLYYSGNTVILDHGLGLYSYFAHLSALDVEEGNHVRRGEVIGRVGATGRVTGPHLHWTVRLIRTRVDPLSLMAVSSEGPESH